MSGTGRLRSNDFPNTTYLNRHAHTTVRSPQGAVRPTPHTHQATTNSKEVNCRNAIGLSRTQLKLISSLCCRRNSSGVGHSAAVRPQDMLQ
ncbi:hypothetical protein CDAR_433081 [Caerostris darwini]|uniref:Uncharacterized protein n=1 Tax=Caerostris darwini TaxID=1538125 RepID=A0AAV4QGY1_9ARAC|nr:hypothetical protein CDAR_433081 [Caerostris darwini]